MRLAIAQPGALSGRAMGLIAPRVCLACRGLVCAGAAVGYSAVAFADALHCRAPAARRLAQMDLSSWKVVYFLTLISAGDHLISRKFSHGNLSVYQQNPDD